MLAHSVKLISRRAACGASESSAEPEGTREIFLRSFFRLMTACRGRARPRPVRFQSASQFGRLAGGFVFYLFPPSYE
jgi:hypothetical protein